MEEGQKELIENIIEEQNTEYAEFLKMFESSGSFSVGPMMQPIDTNESDRYSEHNQKYIENINTDRSVDRDVEEL